MALPVDAVRESRAKRWLRNIRDCVWPMLDRPSGNLRDVCDKPNLDLGVDARDDVVPEVYARLSAEFEIETDRRRAVENKLVAVGAAAPIAVTIMVTAVSFLSSGRVRDLVPVSVIAISVMAFYVALQFLRAMLAAICGLSRKPYKVSMVSEIIPARAEDRSAYLRKGCSDFVRKIEQHREMNNVNVSQLALAHVSMRNAAWALVLGLFFLVGVILCQACGDPQ